MHARVTLGDLVRASPCPDIATSSSIFFEQASRQHTVQSRTSRAFYDRLCGVHRSCGLADLTVVLVDTYYVSAEDVRPASDLHGAFDVAIKMTSHGSVTGATETAAASIGAQAFNFRGPDGTAQQEMAPDQLASKVRSIAAKAREHGGRAIVPVRFGVRRSVSRGRRRCSRDLQADADAIAISSMGSNSTGRAERQGCIHVC